MSLPTTTQTGAATKFKHWMTCHLASEVPLDIALCEHGCRKFQCLQEEWQHCERRLAFIRRRMQTACSENIKAKASASTRLGKRKACADRIPAGQVADSR